MATDLVGIADLPLVAMKPRDFKGKVEPDWCPGCGDFGVLNSLQRACVELGKQPHELLVISGIGCSSNFPDLLPFQKYVTCPNFWVSAHASCVIPVAARYSPIDPETGSGEIRYSLGRSRSPSYNIIPMNWVSGMRPRSK